jgi:uncharacterized membrane protein YfcA
MLSLASTGWQLDWRLPWLMFCSFAGGALNAVAGGGSFLTFPAMLAVGLGPIQANATNTVAMWPGQLTSIAGYRDEVKRNRRLAWRMGAAGLVGGALGAMVLLNTPAMTFLHLVPWLLLTAALIFALSGPVTKRLQAMAGKHTSAAGEMPKGSWLLVWCTAIICFYIGYFGAGAGFLLISLLSLFGFEDLGQMNAMKVVATTMANGVACILFAVSGKVEWHFCLAAMVTCAVGGFASAHFSKRLNQRFLRGLVVFIGLAMAAYFFWRNYH